LAIYNAESTYYKYLKLEALCRQERSADLNQIKQSRIS